jgi:ABC-2 type transport system permease protein
VSRTASYRWFAEHEFRLAWRDLYGMMSGNRPGRGKRILIVSLIISLGLHLLAWAALKSTIANGINSDVPTLLMVSGFLLLPVSLMASQAMESITRAFYTRSDLELILASPAPATKLFAVRMVAIALATTTLTLLVTAPAINVLALTDSAGWLFAYPVVFAFGMMATSFAILLTMGLFTIIGPSKTRLAAQIVAAVVGAGFVIGIQLVAIISIGSISRLQLLQSDFLFARAPEITSSWWLPAMGAMGDRVSAMTLFVIGLLVFAVTLVMTAGSYGKVVLKAASIDLASGPKKQSKVAFRKMSAAAMLRRKEWKLLRRDKWLMSQTLMQLLYLIPPAFMLWHSFGQGSSMTMVIVPVIVMAAGQLAGGLSWLAISGEDAPELVTTAPVSAGQVVRAKVEAILISVSFIAAPLILAIALLSVKSALIAVVCVAASVVSATAIQLWFKAQAKRSNFRRRQTSSRVATMAEAFSSILWAGTAAIWIVGSWAAVIVALLVLAILAFTWWMSPARQSQMPMNASI